VAAQKSFNGYLEVWEDPTFHSGQWVAILRTPGGSKSSVHLQARGKTKGSALRALDRLVTKIATTVIEVDYDLQD
jgi:hypothetical protein